MTQKLILTYQTTRCYNSEVDIHILVITVLQLRSWYSPTRQHGVITQKLVLTYQTKRCFNPECCILCHGMIAKQTAKFHCLMPLVFAELRYLMKWSKCGAVLEYRTSAQVVSKFPAYCETCRFIANSTTAPCGTPF
jgi:hypothetical protein